MRRIKVILAVVAAVAAMTALAAPAMADSELTQTVGGVSQEFSSDNGSSDIGGVLIVDGDSDDIDVGGIELDDVSGGTTLVGSTSDGGGISVG